ncbi:MAG: hypothetical protein ABI857_01715 [Acidobacteriota bacterium]
MPESDAIIDALGGKRVTITIAEKSESGSPTSPDSSLAAIDPGTFTIDNGKQILTITIAE